MADVKKIENVKVKLLGEHSHNGIVLAEGTVVELPADIAEHLCSKEVGKAELVKDAKKTAANAAA